MNLDRRIGLPPSWQVSAYDLAGAVTVLKTARARSRSADQDGTRGSLMLTLSVQPLVHLSRGAGQ
jgi:hypothetical protein